MATPETIFRGLTLGGIWDLNKKPIVNGDLVMDEAYCGVLHLRDIKWRWVKIAIATEELIVKSAIVDLYLAPIKETKKIQGKRDVTHHRVIMEELKLWESYVALKSRASDKEGLFHKDFHEFRVKNEKETFYGFTRKQNNWFGTSCTLNSWIRNWTHVPQVLRDAGKKGTDKLHKDQQINIVPILLWQKVLPWLEGLILVGESWSFEWATSAESTGLDEKAFEEEQICRMRNLVMKNAIGSKMYTLNLRNIGIGRAKPSVFEALSTVLLEKFQKVYRCYHLKHLYLTNNRLTDDHIIILAPVLSKCVNLELLHLNKNEIGEVGCVALCRSIPRSLTTLEIAFNRLGDEACIALCRSLSFFLRDLCLSYNRIGSAGFAELMKWHRKYAWVLVDGNPGASKEVKNFFADKVPAEVREAYFDWDEIIYRQSNPDRGNDVLDAKKVLCSEVGYQVGWAYFRKYLINKNYTTAEIEKVFEFFYRRLRIYKQRIQQANLYSSKPFGIKLGPRDKITDVPSSIIAEAGDTALKPNSAVVVERLEEEGASDSFEDDDETRLKQAILMSLGQTKPDKPPTVIVPANRPSKTITEAGYIALNPDAPVVVKPLDEQEQSDSFEDDEDAMLKQAILISLGQEPT